MKNTKETAPQIMKVKVAHRDAFDVYSPTGDLIATFYNEHTLTVMMQQMFGLSVFEGLTFTNKIETVMCDSPMCKHVMNHSGVCEVDTEAPAEAPVVECRYCDTRAIGKCGHCYELLCDAHVFAPCRDAAAEDHMHDIGDLDTAEDDLRAEALKAIETEAVASAKKWVGVTGGLLAELADADSDEKLIAYYNEHPCPECNEATSTHKLNSGLWWCSACGTDRCLDADEFAAAVGLTEGEMMRAEREDREKHERAYTGDENEYNRRVRGQKQIRTPRS